MARLSAESILDEWGTEAFIDAILEGRMYTEIARMKGVSKGSLIRWVALDPDRSAHAREARESTGQHWDEKAEAVLFDPDLEIARARELASHYRWRASKIAPKGYGDKLQVDSTVTVNQMSDEEIAKRQAQVAQELARLQALEGPKA